jgi:uronate dehydrogenase
VNDNLAPRVLLTGAAGGIGSVLREAWRGGFATLRLVDVRELGPAAAGEELVQFDLTDFTRLRSAVEGIDVVVHLAAISTEDLFSRLIESNVRATFNVFEAARQAGVRRVVFASTNHVTGFYPRAQTIGPDDPVRPDSMYAATKVFGEAVGRLYADKWGMEVVCVRIGSFAERPTSAHALGMWLSPRDAGHLFTRAVIAPRVGYLVVFGLSRNQRSWWHNPGAGVLGYEPLDEAEEAAGEDVKRLGGRASAMLQGGTHTDRDFWVAPEDEEPGDATSRGG